MQNLGSVPPVTEDSEEQNRKTGMKGGRKELREGETGRQREIKGREVGRYAGMEDERDRKRGREAGIEAVR